MFHSNAILVSGLMILIVSNLSECKNRSVLNKEPRVWSFDKQVTCSLCAKDCEHTPKSREERSVSLDSIELDKRLKRMDVQSSIRTLLSRLRPETPLAAFGYTPPPPYSQTSYGRFHNEFSRAPLLQLTQIVFYFSTNCKRLLVPRLSARSIQFRSKLWFG